MPEEFGQRLDILHIDHESTTRRSQPRHGRADPATRTRDDDHDVADTDTQSLADRRTASMTILAQDPDLQFQGRPVVEKIAVPSDRLEPGPRSHRFHVVDLDTSTGTAYGPADLSVGGDPWTFRDRFDDLTIDEALSSFDFHAQNVFAIAARTLGLFEQHLGRRVPWGFRTPHLYLVPHAFIDANAYYSAEDHAVLFGYLPGEEGDDPVYVCLSHDVVAHEVSHALLDGLRPRFIEPGLPDQLAYHEALADIVAFLSVLSSRSLVAAILRAAASTVSGEVPSRQLSRQWLGQTALFGLAEQLGRRIHQGNADALRRSLESIAVGGQWRTRPAFLQPHRRGEVVVAALLSAFLEMWEERLEALRTGPRVSLDRVAGEGARAAGHLLGMVVRAIDYLPPVELEFEDVIDAIVAADEAVAPDDDHHYRDAVVAGFARFDIRPPTRRTITIRDLSDPPRYSSLNRAMLESSADEVFRFIWQNHHLVGIDLHHHVGIERVVTTRRTGPDGLVVDEILADYIQMIDVSAKDLHRLDITAPPGLAADTTIHLLGGGVLVFDQFGRLRRHVCKPLLDTDRQTRRLDYLVSQGLADRQGRFGFNYLAPRGQRFANLHSPVDDEAW